MAKFYIYIITLISCFSIAHAQTGNVGIGTSTPDPSAVLDITATDKGLLIPRISISSLTDGVPFAALTPAGPATGLMIYNTNATIGVGFYFNSGTKASPVWKKILTGADNDWTKATTTSTPAIITDNQYVTGNVGIGDFSAISPLRKLHILQNTSADGLLIQNNTGGASAASNLFFATYADLVAGTSRPGAGISGVDDGNYSANILFNTKIPGADANAITEKMRLTSTGVVGILGQLTSIPSYPTESNLILGANTNTGEGGQLQLNAFGGSYTKAYFLDNYQNRFRIMSGLNTGSSTPIVTVEPDANFTTAENVIAGAALISGDIEIQQGPGTGTDNAYHRVQLSTGYAGNSFSAYATGSYFDGDIKMQGIDIAPLLSTTSSWYHGNANSVGSGTSNGQTCDNCTHSCNCPDGYVATGWEAFAASQLDTYMKLKCTQLNTGYTTVETGTGVESVSSFPNNTGDNITHVSTCPAGTFIKGIAIYANSYLDGNLRVFCTGIRKN